MINVELLKKVLKRVSKDPKHFNMSWFKNKITKKNQKIYPSLGCGTVCCFAGDIVLEMLGPGGLHKLPELSIPTLAQNLARLSDEDRAKLFYPFSNIYMPNILSLTPGTKKYAQFVVGRIKQYFKEQGYVL